MEVIDETGRSWRTNILLDHECLGCTQSECKPNDILIDEYRKMFWSRISAGATEKLPRWEKPHAKTVAWSNDMEGHAKKVRGGMLPIGRQEDGAVAHEVATPCLDDHNFKKEELETVGELSKVCSQIVLQNVCIQHEVADLTFFGL